MTTKRVQDNLIFDIGFHKGEDTYFFLLKGYKVIAVEADINLIEQAKINFKKDINKGQLVLLNYAISDKNNEKIDFYISQNTLWNSVNKNISSRLNNSTFGVQVTSKRLDTLFSDYGIPYYCKIDIEGSDIVALQTLKSQQGKLPTYISVETECLGELEDREGSELKTLYSLYRLGYRKFKLIDQKTLSVLNKNNFYFNSNDKSWFEQQNTNRRYAREQIELNINQKDTKFTDFFPGSSGPFGSELAGRWYKFETAKAILLKQRADKMNLGEPSWSFWCDWHATF